MKQTLRRMAVARKKWSRKLKWLGAKMTGLLRGERARAEDRPAVQRREHAHDLVDEVGLAGPRALVEARHRGRRARVLVGLLADRRPVLGHARQGNDDGGGGPDPEPDLGR